MTTFRHAKGTRLLVNEFELSSYFKDASTNQTVDTPETTAFGANVKSYVVGMTDGRFSLGGMFSGDADGVDEVLQAAFGDETPVLFTYAPEGLLPGRRVWGASAIETSYNVSGSVSDMVAVSAELQGTNGVRSGFSLSNPSSPFSADGSGTVVDQGSSFSGGGYALMHVLSNDSTQNATITIKHSTSSGGVYTTLGTFNTVTAGVATAQRLAIPAGTTMNRYVKVGVAGGVDGAIAIHVNLIRAAA